MEPEIVKEIKSEKKLPIYIWNSNHQMEIESSEKVVNYESERYQTPKGFVKAFYKTIITFDEKSSNLVQ